MGANGISSMHHYKPVEMSGRIRGDLKKARDDYITPPNAKRAAT